MKCEMCGKDGAHALTAMMKPFCMPTIKRHAVLCEACEDKWEPNWEEVEAEE